jgi:hypothetical protein
MSPPAFSGRNRFCQEYVFSRIVAPLLRGADGAARRPYLTMLHSLGPLYAQPIINRKS